MTVLPEIETTAEVTILCQHLHEHTEVGVNGDFMFKEATVARHIDINIH